MRDAYIKSLIEDIRKYPDGKLDLDIVKKSPKRTDKESSDIIYPRRRESAWKH